MMNDLPFEEAAEIALFDVGLTAAFGLLHLLLYLFYPRGGRICSIVFLP